MAVYGKRATLLRLHTGSNHGNFGEFQEFLLSLSDSYRRASFAGVVNIIIMIAMGINVLMNIAGMCTKIMAGETSPIKLAWAMMPPLFYIVGMHT